VTPLWELSGEGWSGHTPGGTAVEGGALVLSPGASTGVFVARLPLTRPVDRVVASLNPDVWAPGAQVRLRVRLRPVDGAFGPWAPLGVYGERPRSEVGPDAAKVEVQVDTLVAPAPVDALEVRLELVRGEGGGPRLRRLALLGWLEPKEATKRTKSPDLSLDGEHPAWGRVLDVPERSQRAEDPAIAGRICSPTSLGMVLGFHGHDLPTAEVARRVLDHGASIYGNWSFNVAFAATLGRTATVARATSMADLEAEVAAGRPVVLSHRYGAGELTGAAVGETDGHLIVARGFTAEGDVVVNDPAAPPAGPIRRVYRRAELARSWLGNGRGICYVVV
jgi:hypothetical protein